MNISKAIVSLSFPPSASFSLALALSHLVRWHISGNHKRQDIRMIVLPLPFSSVISSFCSPLFNLSPAACLLCSTRWTYQMHFQVWNKNISSLFCGLNTWQSTLKTSIKKDKAIGVKYNTWCYGDYLFWRCILESRESIDPSCVLPIFDLLITECLHHISAAAKDATDRELKVYRQNNSCLGSLRIQHSTQQVTE